MAKKSNTKIGNNKEKNDLSLTMQQKFNFDSNELDEEDTKTYKFKRKQNIVRSKREKELIKLKNRYKKKFAISLVTSVILFFLCVCISLLYMFVKPKEKINVITKMPDRVVFIGDSITWMYDLHKHYPNSKYYMVNSGIDGGTTEQILHNMENRIYQFSPKKVIIMIGTNDINQGRSEDEIVDNIKEIIDDIKEKNSECKIYLESLYPINNTKEDKINMEMVGRKRNNDLIKRINSNLKKLADEEKITYINMYDSLLDEDENLKLEYTKEGLHITEEGYDVITDKLKKYIK